MIFPLPQKPKEPHVEDGRTTSWKEPESLLHYLEEIHLLIRNTCLGLYCTGNKLLFYYAMKGATFHNTFPCTLSFYPWVLKAARVAGVNTLSDLNIILSLRTLSWLWVTRDLLPFLESVCGVLRSGWRMVSDTSYMPEA